MAEISVNDAIGLSLWAAKPVKLLDHPDNGKVIDTVPVGGYVGKIYSWIERPKGIYWAFQNSRGRWYYVLHQGGLFKLTKDVQQAADKTQLKYDKEQAKIDAEREQIEKEAKGTIPFYIEKYGKVALMVFVGITIFKTLVNRK